MTIPASRIVSINPGVIEAGGNSLSLNGLFLTQNALMPTGKVYNFASVAAVTSFFGPGSDEAGLASIYFAGYQNSTLKPSGMLFASFNLTARAAFLQSGSLSSLSLTALKALSGVLTVTQDGVAKTSTTITLTGATSFSNAASIIAAAFTGGPAVAWNPVNATFTFTSPTTGLTSTMTFATGSLSAGLNLTQALGAITSQGAPLDTPQTAMANVIAISQNWGSFTTLFEPSTADKQNFAIWSNGQNDRYLYVAWDTDGQAVVQGSTTCFGAIALANNYDGVTCISGDANLAIANGTTLAVVTRAAAAFLCGVIASINFSEQNGRITTAFRTSGSISPTVDNDQLAQNLIANGYNFYGSYATAAQGFIFFYNGQMAGQWEWIDPFVNQIFLNSQFQLALLTLITNIGAANYNPAGYGLIRAALLDPINAALNFGSIRTGVTLSALEAAEVNQAAGVDAASIIQTQGYYLQIADPGAQARQARKTPIINFWYTDGGAVQQITMASIDIL